MFYPCLFLGIVRYAFKRNRSIQSKYEAFKGIVEVLIMNYALKLKNGKYYVTIKGNFSEVDYYIGPEKDVLKVMGDIWDFKQHKYKWEKATHYAHEKGHNPAWILLKVLVPSRYSRLRQDDLARYLKSNALDESFSKYIKFKYEY